MQNITCTRWFPHPTSTIYQTLTTPDKLPQIVKRLQAVDVLERAEEQGRVWAKIDLPGGKVIETEGTVTGTLNQYLAFETEKPFPLQISWRLSPESNGTAVQYTIGVDFSPVIELLSGLVLKGYLQPEMEQDLSKLESLLGVYPPA
ncbi:MAG: SRPBCC family protein [Anaerolineales bacterium]|nr:SRPBCC family protein [Anaerolineales bacterium]